MDTDTGVVGAYLGWEWLGSGELIGGKGDIYTTLDNKKKFKKQGCGSGLSFFGWHSI